MKWKKVFNHLLTTLGMLLALFGLNKYVPIIDFIKDNSEQIWDSVEILIGIILTLIGYFKDLFDSKPEVQNS